MGRGTKKNSFEKAISYSYRLLGIRPRSEKELRNRLFERRFDRATVHNAIEALKEKNLIDDFKFAKLWIESRRRQNPKGDMLLRKELREKGVQSSLIEKALSQRKEKEDSAVRMLAAQKIGSLKRFPKSEQKRKLFNFLARRGFDFDIIQEVIDEVQRD